MFEKKQYSSPKVMIVELSDDIITASAVNYVEDEEYNFPNVGAGA